MRIPEAGMYALCPLGRVGSSRRERFSHIKNKVRGKG